MGSTGTSRESPRSPYMASLQWNWNKLGRTDPLWAILTEPSKMGRKWDAAEFFRTGEDEIARALRHVESLGHEFRRRKALDFGCGVGRLTQALACHFDEVVGVDIAPSMLELARSYNRHGEKCRYLLNEGDDLGALKDGEVDFIYSALVLQHVAPECAKKYLREFVRLLAPGGVLMFQLPGRRIRRESGQPALRKGGIRRVIPISVRTGWRRIKQRIISRIVPGPAREKWRKFKRRITGKPFIEMNGIPKDEVLHVLQECGAGVIDVAEVRPAGSDMASFTYCASKARE